MMTTPALTTAATPVMIVTLNPYTTMMIRIHVHMTCLAMMTMMILLDQKGLMHLRSMKDHRSQIPRKVSIFSQIPYNFIIYIIYILSVDT